MIEMLNLQGDLQHPENGIPSGKDAQCTIFAIDIWYSLISDTLMVLARSLDFCILDKQAVLSLAREREKDSEGEVIKDRILPRLMGEEMWGTARAVKR